ncbi:putative Ig domain-containing protein [Thalassotalea fusca]
MKKQTKINMHFGNMIRSVTIMLLLIPMLAFASSLTTTAYDINKIEYPAGSSPDNFVSLNDKLYFTGKGVFEGKLAENALWNYDNNTKKHKLIKDFKEYGGWFDNFIVVNDKLYFTTMINKAYRSDRTSFLWVHDDSTQQTTLIKQFKTHYIANFTQYNDKLYFALGDDSDLGEYYGTSSFNAGLWTLNESDNSVERLDNVSIYVERNDHPRNTTFIYDDKLFYSNKSSKGTPEVWAYNFKTNANTKIIEATEGSDHIRISAVYNEELYFVEVQYASNPILGPNKKALKAYNKATGQVRNVGEASVNDYVVYDNILYFAGDMDGSEDYELMSYNSETNEINLVANINTEFTDSEIGYGSSFPSNLTIFDKKIYFWAYPTNYFEQRSLWLYDTQTHSTQPVEYGYSRQDSTIAVHDDQLYFQGARENTGNYEPYAISAMENAPSRVLDLYQENRGSSPNNIIEYNQQLYFTAFGEERTRLWVYDPVADKPNLLQDVDNLNHSNEIKFPYALTAHNSKLFFVAKASSNKQQLWYYESETNKIVRVTDSELSNNIFSNGIKLISVNEDLYFISSELANNGSLQFIHKYNNATKSIDTVAEISTSRNYSNIDEFAVYNNKLFFTAYSGNKGLSLYVYDDSDNKLALVSEVNADNSESAIENLTVYKNKLYFTTSSLDVQDTSYQVLWAYDDNTKEAVSVANIPSSADHYVSKRLSSFIVYQEQLFFTSSYEVDSVVPNSVLWAYDESNESLTKIETPYSIVLRFPKVVQDKLFFTGKYGLSIGELTNYQTIIYDNNTNTFSSIEDEVSFVAQIDNDYFGTNDVYIGNKYLGYELIKTNLSGNPALIEGQPAQTVIQNELYSFTPTVSEFENDTLTFSIKNKPSWASFNTETGELSGTPTLERDVVTTENIIISVYDGVFRSLLPPFNIEVKKSAPVTGEEQPPADKAPGGALSWLLALTLILTFIRINVTTQRTSNVE